MVVPAGRWILTWAPSASMRTQVKSVKVRTSTCGSELSLWRWSVMFVVIPTMLSVIMYNNNLPIKL